MQSNGKDCGLFVMVFTVSLLFGKDVSNTTYVLNDMRSHAMYLMDNEIITHFPTMLSISKDDTIAVSKCTWKVRHADIHTKKKVYIVLPKVSQEQDEVWQQLTWIHE